MVDGCSSISTDSHHPISIDVKSLVSIDYEAIRELMRNQKISSFTKVAIITSFVHGRLLSYLLGVSIVLEAYLPRDLFELFWRRQEATIERGELRMGEIDHLLQNREDLELPCFHYFCYFCYLIYLSIIHTIITMCSMNMSEQSLLLDLGFSNRLINVTLTQQLLGCLEIQFNHLVMH